jgi:predicted nucleotidyltransferase
MATKPQPHAQTRTLTYTPKHWQHLAVLRQKATEIMAALDAAHLYAVVHGSVARGDVKTGSDVDVFVAEVQNSFLVEAALERARIAINSRLLVQATPTYAMKAHLQIDETTTVTFPLMEMRRVEREFYRFGGEATLTQLQADVRVAGVDKRLMLIEPTDAGHMESSVVGHEESAARLLRVSAETVQDRVRVLLKRDSVGRTGVFVKRELAADETFELALKKLAEANPAVRRRMKK